MKKVFSILLVIFFGMQFFAKELIWLNYQSNLSYIKQYLCEKKVADCHGKCYLKKQLDKTENNLLEFFKFKAELLFFYSFDLNIPLYYVFVEKFRFPSYSFPLCKEAISSIYHPPTF